MQLESRCADFHDILYEALLLKFVKEIQVCLKSSKTKATFDEEPITINDYFGY